MHRVLRGREGGEFLRPEGERGERTKERRAFGSEAGRGLMQQRARAFGQAQDARDGGRRHGTILVHVPKRAFRQRDDFLSPQRLEAGPGLLTHGLGRVVERAGQHQDDLVGLGLERHRCRARPAR